jgi:hypothetical protein
MNKVARLSSPEGVGWPIVVARSGPARWLAKAAIRFIGEVGHVNPAGRA